MELIKRNIHMDRVIKEAVSQITLEEDLNLPENKPDVSALSLQRGTIIIDEIKPGTDCVHVRGRLMYSILYQTQENGCGLVVLEGKIPFEQKINLSGTHTSDAVRVNGMVEDLSISMINSRKLSLQALIALNAIVEDVEDVEVPIAIQGNETIEYRKQNLELAQLAVHKNDIFRIKEELTLPANYPNIFQILWNNIGLQDVEFKASDGRLMLQGDINAVFLYEGEGEDHPIRSFETTIPFNGSLDCHGCEDGMIPAIAYNISQQELTIRPDFDGEERNIMMDLVLDIGICIYEEENVEVISDLYGVTMEVETSSSPANLKRLLTRVLGKSKINERIRIKNDSGAILQLLYTEGTVTIDSQEVVQDGILLSGNLTVNMVFVTGDDAAPFKGVQQQIPFQYTLEVPGIEEGNRLKIVPTVEQLRVTMLDGEEADVKAVLGFSTVVFQNINVDLLKQVAVTDIDGAKKSILPGIAIYVVKPGDNLWNIGKRYYVSVDDLKKWNDLTTDLIKPGQKLLIVKEIA